MGQASGETGATVSIEDVAFDPGELSSQLMPALPPRWNATMLIRVRLW